MKIFAPQQKLISARNQGFFIAATAIGSVALLAFAIWLNMDSLAFQGADGKGFQTHILNYLHNSRPLEVNMLSSLQGAFAQQLPLNTWLNPGYVVFRLVGWNAAMFSSMLISFFALAISTFLLARVIGLGWIASAIAGQAAAITVPPFLIHFGLNSQYMLVPPTTSTIALLTLSLAAFLKLDPLSVRQAMLTGAVLAALIFAAMIVDPLFFIVASIAMVPIYLIFGLEHGRSKSALLRVFALVLAILLLYVFGVFDYISALVRPTYRTYFKLEIGRPQNPSEATMLLTHPYLFGRLMLLVAAGWFLALFFARGRLKMFAVACIVHWIFVLAQATVYIFSAVDWPGLAPIYLEHSAYHLYFLGAVIGWTACLERLVSTRHGRASSALMAGRGWALAVAPMAMLVYLIEAVPGQRSLHSEPWPNERVLIQALLNGPFQKESNRSFSGSIVVLDTGDQYDNILSIVQLWKNGIPTLNEYGQLVTPTMHFFRTRVLGNGDMSRITTNAAPSYDVDARAYAALGASHILSTRPRAIDGTIDRGIVEGHDYKNNLRQWHLYEITGYNRGDYSPTRIQYANTAEDIAALLAAKTFDYRRTAIVESAERMSGLVQATDAGFTYSRGQLRVAAASTGQSLIVLPVQFSRCLAFAGATGDARLVRVDMLLTGMLFTGKVEAEINYDFGFFNSGCRNADVNDLRRLQFVPSRHLDADFRHPYAISSRQTLAASLGKLEEVLKQAAANDKNLLPSFDGRTVRWLRKTFGSSS